MTPEMQGKRALLSPEALEFAPGLLSIQESPPGRLPRTVMYTVSTLFVIVAGWAYFGKLDIIASAEGRLVPQSYVKIVQPADAGIVEEILVKEGQKVQAGQVMMRMDARDALADEKTLRTELALKSLQLRRVSAELAGIPMTPDPADPKDLYVQVEAQYRDHRQSYDDDLSHANEALHRAQQEYESGKEVLAKLREVTPILKQDADAYADMGRDGYAPQMQVHDKMRDYLEKARDLRAQEDTVESLSAAIAEATKQVAQVTSKYRSDLQNERVQAEGEYRKLQQDWVKLEHKTDLLELRAPQAGIVKDISTHTAGTVVSPGTVLLTLVPESEPLVAEVMVKNDDVGFVTPGQQAKIKLAAYPFEKYGMLDGEVTRIGPDASDNDNNRQADGKEPSKDKPQTSSVYKALISFHTQTLESPGNHYKLVPGMQVIAEINQGRRTVMDYLLSPVARTLHDSGRER